MRNRATLVGNICIASPAADTDCTPYEWQTVASRTIYCCGNSIIRAAEDAKNQMLRLASLKFDIPGEDLDLKDGHIVSKIYPDKKVAVTDLAMGLTMPDGSVESTGPWGARGIAEPCMVPTASAIANAVFDAIGCRINSLPITAEKVLKAIMEKRRDRLYNFIIIYTIVV